MILSRIARPVWTMIMLAAVVDCGGGGSGGPATTPRPRVCSTMSSGCACGTGIVGDGTPTCDTSSVVKQVGQQGFCCQTDFVCQCRVRECVVLADSNYCLCGNPQDPLGAMRVDDCSQAMPGLMCCLNSFGCMCGTTPCGDPSENVPSCGIGDVTKCDTPEQSVASCT